jgi:DNA-binding FadR family transcriptional regulator
LYDFFVSRSSLLNSALSRPPGLPKPKRRSAHAVAVENIGQRIVTGVYPAGSVLPSWEDLTLELGISRTALREAMQTLAAKGMLQARAKVGTRVLDPSAWNMFDADILSWREAAGLPESSLAMFYEMRQSLEPVAAALAAERRSDADVEALTACAEKLRLESGDVATFVAADVAFHRLILEMSGNPFMRSIGALISTALTASFTASAPTQSAEEGAEVRRQHLDIVDAIARRDAQGASDAMTKVILQGWTRYSDSPLRRIAAVSIAAFP